MEKEGNLEKKPLQRSYKKVNPERLKAYVAEHPEAYQTEIAEQFGCSATAIYLGSVHIRASTIRAK